MVFLLTVLASFVLIGLAGFHLYWAGGGQWGVRYVIPEINGEPMFRPGPTGTVLVAMLLIWGALVLLDVAFAGFLIRRYPMVVLFTLWLYGVSFTGRALIGWFLVVVLGRGKRTPFAHYELRVYGPMCLLLGMVFLLLALVLTP